MTLSGKIALITGASGDIGSAVTAQFVAAGAVVVMTDVSMPSASDNASGTGASDCIFKILDVTNESDWQQVISEVESEYGRLDILVNAAGIYQANVQFDTVSYQDWKRHFDVNCDGIFLGCQYAGKSMKEHFVAGAIVNICSRFSIVPSATRSAYCASKAAALMLTKVAAEALGESGIRVNAILPGPIDSEMLIQNQEPHESSSEMKSRLSLNTSLKRLATPDDVAETVVFLASEYSRNVSGTSIEVGC